MESEVTSRGVVATAEAANLEQKKRTRIRLSCTNCRDKKLKCNRQAPCDQCEKRKISASCEIIPYESQRNGTAASSSISVVTPPLSTPNGRARATSSEPSMQARIRHLEHLVQVLKSQRRDTTDTSTSDPEPTLRAKAEEDEDKIPCLRFRETVGNLINDLRYVDGANWETILEDITTLTKDLKTHEPDPVFDLAATRRGPILLLGLFPPSTVTEMLAYLPPRPVADRLIARLVHANEPPWIILHVKSFLRKYESFWEDPSNCSLTWLGLVFLMLSHAALLCLRSDEVVPGNMGTPLEIFEATRTRGAQCLALDDYTRPGEYKVEALILYFGTEFLRHTDSLMGVSMLVSVIVRLALHMGYHRDPRHYKNMSVFEGEMRRRIWLILVGIDQVTSFQFGLPTNIHSIFYDTEPPRNLLDDDFDESSQVLPPSRPESERTLVLYSIAKDRILKVFGEIVTAVTARIPIKYAETQRLNKTLEEAHDQVPSCLHYKPFSQSLIDPVDLIMQRLWIELLYQKSRTILHRRYLFVARMAPIFTQSRLICLDAATKILRHQHDIYSEIQPGGRLARDQWFMSSVSSHDFLLADMILSLELSYLYAQEGNPIALPQAVEHLRDDKSTAIISKEKILEILQASSLVWKTMRHTSSEANRAFKILSDMLAKSTGVTFEDSSSSVPESSSQTSESVAHTVSSTSTAEEPTDKQSTSRLEANIDDELSEAANFWWPPGQPPPFGDLSLPSNPDWGVNTELVDFPGLDLNLSTDWTLWDNQIHTTADTMDISWDTFFQPPPGM